MRVLPSFRRFCLSTSPLAIFLTTSLFAASSYRLGFSGPTTIGNGTEAGDAVFFCTMNHSGDGPGARGWSISLTVEGGTIQSIDLEETTAKTLLNDGFDHSELTHGENNEGAVSAVVLNFFEIVRLPPNETSTIARITVHGGPGPVTLKYVDGRKGQGVPVPNIVTEDEVSITPAFDAKALNAQIAECDSQIGDKITGAWAAPDDEDIYTFPALDGTVLNLSVKTKKVGTLPPVVHIFDPSGSELDLSGVAVGKKTAINVKKLTLPAIGTYSLHVLSSEGAVGNYALTTKGKAPKDKLKVKGVFTSSIAGEAFEQTFSGLENAVVKGTLKAKNTTPEIIELIGPDGQPVTHLPASLISGPKAVKIVNLVLPQTGSYTFRFRGGSILKAEKPAILTLSFSQKPPKGVKSLECE